MMTSSGYRIECVTPIAREAVSHPAEHGVVGTVRIVSFEFAKPVDLGPWHPARAGLPVL